MMVNVLLMIVIMLLALCGMAKKKPSGKKKPKKKKQGGGKKPKLPAKQPKGKASLAFKNFFGWLKREGLSYGDSVFSGAAAEYLFALHNKVDTDYGVAPASNTWNLKLLERLIDTYFDESVATKIDDDAKDNYMRAVNYAIPTIINMKLKYAISAIHPPCAKSDTDTYKPFVSTTHDSIMSTLSSNGIMVPTIAWAIAKLFCFMFQFDVGVTPQRKRPAYLMQCLPWMSASTVIANLDILRGFADSRIYMNQAGLTGIELTREMIEEVTIISPNSTLGFIICETLPMFDSAASYDYAWSSSEPSIIWKAAWGLPDEMALGVLYRLSSSSYGGLMAAWSTPAAGYISMSRMDISPGAGATTLGTTLADTFTSESIPWLRMLAEACSSVDVHNAVYTSQIFRLVATGVVPSEDAWNAHFIGYMLSRNALNVPIRYDYIGEEIFADISMAGLQASLGAGGYVDGGEITPPGSVFVRRRWEQSSAWRDVAMYSGNRQIQLMYDQIRTGQVMPGTWDTAQADVFMSSLTNAAYQGQPQFHDDYITQLQNVVADVQFNSEGGGTA